MLHKIFITGPVGGGKSTLSRRLSQSMGCACVELDGIVYQKDPKSPEGNRKRPEREADAILLVWPPSHVRKSRIVLRWIKQNRGQHRTMPKCPGGCISASSPLQIP